MESILFNTEMVKAILDGKKTETRRIIKNANEVLSSEFRKKHPNVADKHLIQQLCHPNCYVGDILYVRESFCDRWLPDGLLTGIHRYGYKADGAPSFGMWGDELTGKTGIWKPSIHMPKKAARILLKIKNIYVEQLHDITTEKAKREGFEDATDFGNTFLKLYPKTDGDTWVWVIEFEVIKNEI